MSVRFPKHAVSAKVIAIQEFLANGSLSGQDSDWNVQATGIAIQTGEAHYFLFSKALKNASMPSRNSAGS